MQSYRNFFFFKGVFDQMLRFNQGWKSIRESALSLIVLGAYIVQIAAPAMASQEEMIELAMRGESFSIVRAQLEANYQKISPLRSRRALKLSRRLIHFAQRKLDDMSDSDFSARLEGLSTRSGESEMQVLAQENYPIHSADGLSSGEIREVSEYFSDIARGVSSVGSSIDGSGQNQVGQNLANVVRDSSNTLSRSHLKSLLEKADETVSSNDDLVTDILILMVILAIVIFVMVLIWRANPALAITLLALGFIRLVAGPG